MRATRFPLQALPLAAAAALLAACSDTPAPVSPLVGAPALVKSGPASTSSKGRIVFTASYDQQGNSDLYIMNADGTGIRRLTTDPRLDREASVSTDGRRIAFIRAASGSDNHGDVWIMNADGTGELQLTNTPDVAESDPAISPDGRSVVFTHQQMTGSSPSIPMGDSEIGIVAADGTGFTLITDNDDADRDPSWSRKGDRIVLISARDGNPPEVFTMAPNGSAVTRVTVNTIWEARPAFSPDDRLIVFTTAAPSPAGLYVMQADGTNVSQLNSAGTQPYSASWAPSGKEIVFDAMANQDVNLFVATIGSVGERQLTTAGLTLMPFWTK